MPPRIAYFPDSFHEVNGVAHTSRNFAAYAQRHGIPMLCVRAGATTRLCPAQGSVEALELGRSPLAIRMEQDLSFDPLFVRYSGLISHTVRAFRPDVIHITGPSELGMFGAYFAWRLGIPLVASWHTNIHEYAARRTRSLFPKSSPLADRIEPRMEAFALAATLRFYDLARVHYAPNPQLCTLLHSRTGKPCHLMQRGVETDLFTPDKRTLPAFTGLSSAEPDTAPTLGFVGRLSVEKNVALLPRIDRELRARGIHARWLIVGHGAEEANLRAELPHATFAGVLRGEPLAHAYANMDLLVFPSHTDTFGNVVLEALASAVPAIVTPHGGPAHIVQHGLTGAIAEDDAFSTAIAQTLSNPATFAAMRQAARTYAQGCSWDAVFDRVLAAYPTTR